MALDLIIFDFDGVIADSEGLANDVLAAYATELGVPMDRAASLAAFGGRRAEDVLAQMERLAGRPIDGFDAEWRGRTFAAFERELREVRGASDFLADHAHIRACIASSSSLSRINLCLRVLQLEERFRGHVYSADEVARGKPFPDLFLHAAHREGVNPARAIVIEDSPNGVRAAVAAGMRAIGLTAASHLADTHAELLREAGANFLTRDYAEIREIVARLSEPSPRFCKGDIDPGFHPADPRPTTRA